MGITKKSLTLLAVTTLLCVAMGVALGMSISAAPPVRPTPTPGIPSPEDVLNEPVEATVARPDLIVSSITTDLPTRLDVTTTIRVTIKNQGDADVRPGNNFFVDLYVDPAGPPTIRETGTLSVPVQGYLLRRGQEVPLTFQFVFTRTRSYELYAQVDTDGNVVEAIEDNNVLGPVYVPVRTGTCVADVHHEDFQAGFSNMDTSHPVGLVTLSGIYEEPITAPLGRPYDNPLQGPTLYNPDFGVSRYRYAVSQIAPVMARNAAGHLYVAWEDGRNGETRNRDIFFSRSTDNGTTWSTDVRVNQDPPERSVNQRAPTMVYDRVRNTIYIAWQDERNGHYDIWFARSTDGGQTWTEPASNPINDDTGDADQLNPSLAVDSAGNLYIVWQDRRHGNDDIYFAASTDGGNTWCDNILVTDHPASTAQAQRSPAITVAGERIYIVWEDARNAAAGDAGDIYFTWGKACLNPPCPPYSFDVDRRVNNDTTLRTQRDPTIVASTPRIEITRTEVFTPGSPMCSISPPITTEVTFVATYVGTAIHFAWQDYRHGANDPDIYYAWTFAPLFYLESVTATPDYQCALSEPFETFIVCPFGSDYPIFGNEAVNDIPPPTPLSCLEPPYSQGEGSLPCEPPRDSALPCDRPKRMWNIAGSVQEYPAFSPGPPGSDIVYILWSDRRNFDAWNADIYMARPQRERDSPMYEVSENVIVNDNAKLLRYLQGNRYLYYAPASVRQYRPAGTYADYADAPYIVWDDDRRADPLAGYALERNIFFARPGRPPSPGVFISRIFEANKDTRWNLLEWWGVTPACTKIFFQTRTGNTPWPDSSWSDWTGPVWDANEGMWVYPAPAEIVDASHNRYPTARYLQYRFWIRDCDEAWKPPFTGQRLPQAWVSKVVIHYSPKTYTAALPMIVKRWNAPAPTPTPTRTPTATPAPKIPNDAYYPNYQWNMRRINMPQAWGISVGSPGVLVAVVDTGIDQGHPDLAGKVVGGYDLVHNDADASDDNGHGTHVAGIIGAVTDNGLGMAGIAWHAQLVSIKVLDANGIGAVSSVASGILKAVNDYHVPIINLSLGMTQTNAALQDAVTYAYNQGVLLVAAAGNSYQAGNPTIYPAAYSQVVAVGATGDRDEHAAYSEAGPWLDLVAPGGNPTSGSDTERLHWIYSLYWRGSPRGGNPTIGYMPVAGTSQACPHVAGLAALMRSIRPSLTRGQIESILKNTAVDLGSPGRDDMFGYGRINAPAAVQAVIGGVAFLAEPAQEQAGEDLVQSELTAEAAIVPGRILVRFREEAVAQARAEALQAIGAQVVGEIPKIGWVVLQVEAGSERAKIAQLRANPAVRYAEPDHIIYALHE